MITVFLWIGLVLETISVIVTVSEARKPREAVDSGPAGCAALLLVLMAIPLIMILFGGYTGAVVWVAAALAVALSFSCVVMIREIFGLRGPRTPLSVTLWTLASLLAMAGWIFLIMRV